MAKDGAQVWKATHHHRHSITTKDLYGMSAGAAAVEQHLHEKIASVCPADQTAEAMTTVCSRI